MPETGQVPFHIIPWDNDLPIPGSPRPMVQCPSVAEWTSTISAGCRSLSQPNRNMAQREGGSDESLVVILMLGKGRGNDAHGTWDGDAPNLQRSAIRYIDLLHAVCTYRTAAYAPTPYL
jgi:hypothetical protein